MTLLEQKNYVLPKVPALLKAGTSIETVAGSLLSLYVASI